MRARMAASLVVVSITVGALVAGGVRAVIAADSAADAVFTRQDGTRASLRVEVADDPGEITCGLMFRRSLPAGQGMLFAQESPDGFWMRNTLVPLSVAFVAHDGTVIGISDMRPAPHLGTTAYVLPGGAVTDVPDRRVPPAGAKLLTYPPPGRHSYAIEANRGWFAEHGVAAGDHVDVAEALRRATAAQPPRCARI